MKGLPLTFASVFRLAHGRQGVLAAFAVAAFIVAALFASHGIASGANGDVMGVRFGGDADRTRVVVDMVDSARGRVARSGEDGSVVVTLAGVSAGRGLDGSGSGLVRRYAVSADGSGVRLALDLSRPVEIERRFMLPPGDGVNHYRYVLDLKAVAGRAPSPAPARAAPPPRERPLIIIDAGHGGRDPGTLGAEIQEKQVTLPAARVLKAELERTGRYRVQLTRDSDVYIGLERRIQIARDAGADLFISLHADSSADPATRGASVYTLSEQGATRAVRQVMREEDWHRDLRLPGQDASVDRILLDMTQRATQNRSAQFARSLVAGLEQSGRPMLRRSHRDAGFVVLLAPDVPAVLLEMGFVTNPEDARLLADERHRRTMMRAVAESIDAYFRGSEGNVQLAAVGSGVNGAP